MTLSHKLHVSAVYTLTEHPICLWLSQVPSLEHNNKVIGESLDLIKYVDSNFEGPSLLPNVSCNAPFLLLLTVLLPLPLFKKKWGDQRLVLKLTQVFKLVQDPEKQKFAEELIAYSDTFVKEVYGSFKKDAQILAGEVLLLWHFKTHCYSW